MNLAVAYYLAQDQSGADGHPRPPRRAVRPDRREKRERRRRLSALLAVAVTLFTASLGGIAFATSGDDPSQAGPSAAAAGSSESDAPSPRPGRAGPGYAH